MGPNEKSKRWKNRRILVILWERMTERKTEPKWGKEKRKFFSSQKRIKPRCQNLLKTGESKELQGLKPKTKITNLNSTMVLVVSEAKRAESSVHTIQTVHIAFALVGISV